MSFNIKSINLFFIHNFRLQNLKFKYLIDDIVTDIWFYGNFASMKDIRKNM